MPDVAPVSAVVAEGAAALAASGIAEPAREAHRLWAELQGITPGEGYLQRAEAARPETAAAFARAVERRRRGEPLAYVTGLAGFRRLTLRSDRRALIPRPETEGLVDEVLARAPGGVAVDVGTGSGCIALSLAQEGRYRAVIAVDRSADALALARENARAAGLPVHLVRGDLASALGAERADVIVSNPPYLTETEYAALDPAVRDWEPGDALVSGPDGLAATTRLLRDAAASLRPGGWLALELDCARAADAAARARGLGWGDVVVRTDLFGRERYLLARRSEAS